MTTGENPEIRIQRLWTILEHLQANGCVISNYLQGILPLKAIPREWDTVAQMYFNGMQMTNVTFSGVCDTIMAEFDENEDYGGALPPIPYHPVAPQGPPAFQQPPPLPPAVSSGRGSPLWLPERDDDDDLSYMEDPSPPVHTLTPPIREQRPVTPQRPIRHPPVHPLGWRRVGTRQDDLDNPDKFKWVPEHLTPRSFLDEHKKQYAKAPIPTFVDYEHLPAYWTPS